MRKHWSLSTAGRRDIDPHLRQGRE